ncbi:hypothetical protein FIBSPDRAFT_896407 [Athelia psychrophila]|uniref:Uncharacterized protein n=1 Tax=Athelia psychrophila TaxID=1759441 RepID=A0A166DG09_9AGAM|nr:hypothetical protein FIBSPDRAFT_896407 [Fibularhizoctonia sp. CBS 109695]
MSVKRQARYGGGTSVAVALKGVRVATGVRESSAPAAAPLAAERVRCAGELRVGAGMGEISVAPGRGLAARDGGSKGVRARMESSTMRHGGRTCGSSIGKPPQMGRETRARLGGARRAGRWEQLSVCLLCGVVPWLGANVGRCVRGSERGSAGTVRAPAGTVAGEGPAQDGQQEERARGEGERGEARSHGRVIVLPVLPVVAPPRLVRMDSVVCPDEGVVCLLWPRFLCAMEAVAAKLTVYWLGASTAASCELDPF